MPITSNFHIRDTSIQTDIAVLRVFDVIHTVGSTCSGSPPSRRLFEDRWQ